MRVFKDVNINQMNIKPHNVIFSHTSERDYEMSRIMLLEKIDGLESDEYLLLEGYHCSCYDFDETNWDAIIYTMNELQILAQSKGTHEKPTFWNMVLNY